MGIDIITEWEKILIETKLGTIELEIFPVDTRTVMKLMHIKPDQFPDIFEEFFPDHIRNVKGLTVNGKEPTAEDFATNIQLLPIATKILTKITDSSKLLDADEKNLKGLSDLQMSDSQEPN